MTKVCVKCGYLRQAGDIASEYECPKCGVVYAKAEAALHHDDPATGGEQSEGGRTNESTLPSSGNHDKNSTCTEKPDHGAQEHDTKFTSVDDALIPPPSKNLGIVGLIAQFKVSVLVAILVAVLFGIAYTVFHESGAKGQAFIVTEARANIRLGAMEVKAYRKSDLDKVVRKMKAKAKEMDAELDLELARAKLDGLLIHLATIEGQLDKYSAKAEYPSLHEMKPVATAETDADGGFSLDLPYGDYVIVAESSRNVIGKRERYNWMFYVDPESMKKPILINNSNLQERDNACAYCVKPIEDDEDRTNRINQLKLLRAEVRPQFEAQMRREAAEDGERVARMRGVERQVENSRLLAQDAEKQARLEMLEANRREIDKLRASIPDFDSTYRAPAGCQADNPSMTQLLACGRARADAQRAHDQRYAAARIRLKELEAEQQKFEPAQARPTWSRY